MPNKNALIVDDEAVVRNSITRALNNWGMKVKSAASGKEALEVLHRHPIDLILLDIRMPDMDGITLLKEIRAKHPEKSVIMVTGYPTIDTAVHCTKLGALDYLVKPFRLDDLEASLKKAHTETSPSPESPAENQGLRINPRGALS